MNYSKLLRFYLELLRNGSPLTTATGHEDHVPAVTGWPSGSRADQAHRRPPAGQALPWPRAMSAKQRKLPLGRPRHKVRTSAPESRRGTRRGGGQTIWSAARTCGRGPFDICMGSRALVPAGERAELRQHPRRASQAPAQSHASTRDELCQHARRTALARTQSCARTRAEPWGYARRRALCSH